MNNEEIRQLRKKLGQTQKEFAERIGVDQVTVNRWENKKRKPSKLALRNLQKNFRG